MTFTPIRSFVHIGLYEAFGLAYIFMAYGVGVQAYAVPFMAYTVPIKRSDSYYTHLHSCLILAYRVGVQATTLLYAILRQLWRCVYVCPSRVRARKILGTRA